MKHVVVSSGLQEDEIRPPSLMSEFKKLSLEEAQVYFGDPSKLTEVSCPGCGFGDSRDVFEKEGFSYRKCSRCKSLFVSPRPQKEILEDYFDNSRASRFRVEHLAKDTARARRAHLIQTNINWLGRLVDEAGNPQAKQYTDVGTTLPQVFEEVSGLGLFEELYSLDPLEALATDCEQAGATVIHAPIPGQGAVTAFEKLEHQFSPLEFVQSIKKILAPGGILFFTTRTISGFDLQILWDKTPYIFVPEHLNLLSIDGIHLLLERAGLELIELSTPGQLDLQLIQHAAASDPSIQIPPFFRYLLNKRDAEAHEDFQEFLQKHRLSSHVRVAARKRKERTEESAN